MLGEMLKSRGVDVVIAGQGAGLPLLILDWVVSEQVETKRNSVYPACVASMPSVTQPVRVAPLYFQQPKIELQRVDEVGYPME